MHHYDHAFRPKVLKLLVFLLLYLTVKRRNGAQGRNRTTDTAIFSRMLYQLSYLGQRAGARQWRGL